MELATAPGTGRRRARP